MNISYKLWGFLFFLIWSSGAMATDVKCTGMYPNGGEIHLFWDGETDKLNINGTLHDVEKFKQLRGKNFIILSENYINTMGEYICIAITFMPPHYAHLSSINVATRKVRFETDLSCYKK